MPTPNPRPGFNHAFLEARRRELKMPRERIALELGVGAEAVRNWESGHRTPRTGYVVALAAVLDCSPTDLLVPAGDAVPA